MLDPSRIVARMITTENAPATKIVVTWLHGDLAYGRSDATYTATLLGVDAMRTATFRRDEDGFLGVAGAGCWECA